MLCKSSEVILQWIVTLPPLLTQQPSQPWQQPSTGSHWKFDSEWLLIIKAYSVITPPPRLHLHLGERMPTSCPRHMPLAPTSDHGLARPHHSRLQPRPAQLRPSPSCALRGTCLAFPGIVPVEAQLEQLDLPLVDPPVDSQATHLHRMYLRFCLQLMLPVPVGVTSEHVAHYRFVKVRCRCPQLADTQQQPCCPEPLASPAAQ